MAELTREEVSRFHRLYTYHKGECPRCGYDQQRILDNPEFEKGKYLGICTDCRRAILAEQEEQDALWSMTKWSAQVCG